MNNYVVLVYFCNFYIRPEIDTGKKNIPSNNIPFLNCTNYFILFTNGFKTQLGVTYVCVKCWKCIAEAVGVRRPSGPARTSGELASSITTAAAKL